MKLLLTGGVAATLALHALAASPELVNNGGSTDNLQRIASVNSGFDTRVELKSISLGSNDVLEADQVEEGVLFFPLRQVWYATDRLATGGVYRVSADFKPGAVGDERRGGVMGWLEAGETTARGIGFYVRPAVLGGEPAGFALTVVDFKADSDEASESVTNLFNLDGTPATMDLSSALSELGGYNPSNFATFEISFTLPIAADRAVVSNATARVTARVVQADGSGPTNQTGRVIELITDLPVPASQFHRFGYYAYWGKVFDTGVIGQLDNLMASGDVQIPPNAPPVIFISSPADGAIFTDPDEVTVLAEANDSDGSVRRVEFFANETKIGETTSAPFSFLWLDPPLGIYSLTARALDDRGASTVSTNLVDVTIRGNLAPAVSITSPTNGASFLAPDSLVIEASATDTDGTVAKVEFFVDGGTLSVDEQAPFSATWLTPAYGTHTLTARATDERGLTNQTFREIVVTISSNSPPTVTITDPLDGETFTAPASIPIAILAGDDGLVTEVTFFANNGQVGNVASPNGITSTQFDWKNVPEGTYTLAVRARDNSGQVTDSTNRVVVTVRSGAPPTLGIQKNGNVVVISWPAAFTGFSLEAADTIGATAWTAVPGVTNNTATLPTSGIARFFRLVRR